MKGLRSSLFILACALLFSVADVSAERSFEASAQVRHRFEADARDFAGDTNPLTFSLLRTRLGLAYAGDESVSAFVQLQDARTWGEEFSTLFDGSADRFDMHQGYILAKQLFFDPVTLKLGRMEVKYGSERLIGAVGWSNIGRAFDGAIVTVKSRRFVPDVFYFAEVESVQVGERGDLSVFGMNADIITSDRYDIQVYGIGQRNVPSDVLSRGTVGFYARGDHGAWGHEVEAAYQFGNLTPRDVYGSAFAADSVEVDIGAYMFTLNMWYRAQSVSGRPAVSAGVELLSGSKADQAEDATFKSFDTLYATNHKFYGYMDYFLNIPVNTFGRGLVDIHGKADATFAKNDARLAFHVLRSHEEFVLAGGSTSKSFGSELDATYVHKYSQSLNFVLGASAFWAGEIFKERRGEDTSWWVYVMTTLNV